MMANIESPIPLSEIESVLAWVDTFKLSRATKKINRDFSDAGKALFDLFLIYSCCIFFFIIFICICSHYLYLSILIL